MSQGASDASTPVGDHGALTGLGDDDHTQYLKTKGGGGAAADIPEHTHASAATGGQFDHGAAAGLADDDHTIYVKADGTRAFTGAVTFTDGTAAAPSVHGADIDTGVYFDAGIVSLAGNGSALLRASEITNEVTISAITKMDGTEPIIRFYEDSLVAGDFWQLGANGAGHFGLYQRTAPSTLARLIIDFSTGDWTFHKQDGGTTLTWDESDGRWEFATAPYYTNHLIPFVAHVDGILSVTTGALQIPMAFPGTLVYTRCRVSTAPTGASIVFDVNKGAVGASTGTTVYGTATNPTITATNFDSGNAAPDATTFIAGDWFSIDVDSVGSTIAGSNAVITLWVRPD